MAEKISYDDFKKVEMKVGIIKTVERVPDTDRLLKLTVDLGEEEPRQIVSGIAEYFPEPEALIEKQATFVTNLEPRTIRGYESNGMILALTGTDGSFALLVPHSSVPAGTFVS